MRHEDIELAHKDYMKATGGSPEAAATLVLAEVLLSLLQEIEVSDDAPPSPEPRPVGVTVKVNGTVVPAEAPKVKDAEAKLEAKFHQVFNA